MQLRCGSVAVAVNRLFVFISSSFAMFKNVEHSLEMSNNCTASDLETNCLHNICSIIHVIISRTVGTVFYKKKVRRLICLSGVAFK